MTHKDFRVVFQGAIRLRGEPISVHGAMRVEGPKREGRLVFPAGVLPELGRYYRLTLTDGSRLEIVVDDWQDGAAIFTVLEAQRPPGIHPAGDRRPMARVRP